jgi:hypothetical protein
VKAAARRFAGDLGDQPVQALVDAGDQGGVLGVGVGLGQKRVQPRDVLLGRALGGQADERHLEQHAGLEQLVDRDALGLEHAGHRVAHAVTDALLGGGGDEDPAARPLGGADEVRARQQPQRLAERGAADAELASEVLLAPEPVPGAQAGAVHVDADRVGDLLADAAADGAAVGICAHGAAPSSRAGAAMRVVGSL